MALLLRPERWLAKPPAGTPLDPSHPLAAGLRLFIPFNEGGGAARDVVTGRLAYVPNGTNSAWAARPGGMALTAVGANLGSSLGGSGVLAADPQWQVAAPLTVLCDFHTRTVGFVTSTLWGATNATQSGANNGYSAYINSGDSSHHVAIWAGASFVDLSIGALTQLRRHQIAITYDGATVKFWADGILKASAAHTGALVYPTTGFQVGQEGDNAAGNDTLTDAYAIAIWNRALSGAELQQLFATPFVMLRPRADAQRYFLPPPAAGAQALVGSAESDSSASAALTQTPQAAQALTGSASSSSSASAILTITPVPAQNLVGSAASESAASAVLSAGGVAQNLVGGASSASSASAVLTMTPAAAQNLVGAAQSASAASAAITEAAQPAQNLVGSASSASSASAVLTETPSGVVQHLVGAASSASSASGALTNGVAEVANWEIGVNTAANGANDLAPACVRDSSNFLWRASNTSGTTFDNNTGTYNNNTMRMFRCNTAGVASAFTEKDSAHRPTNVGTFALAIDGSDLIHVAYVSPYAAAVPGIYYVTFNTTTNLWGTPVKIGTANYATTASYTPGDTGVTMALDAAGAPHVVHYGQTSGTGTTHIFYTNKTSGSWSAAVQLDTASLGTNQRCMHPACMFDSTGALHVTWMTITANYGTTLEKAYYIKRSSGGTWGSVTAFTDNLLGSVDNGPALYVSEDDHVHIVYGLGDGTDSSLPLPDGEVVTGATVNNKVFYRFSADGGATWNTTTQPPHFVAHNFALGPDGQGGIRLWSHSQPAHVQGVGQAIGYAHLPVGSSTWTAWTQVAIDTNSDGYDCGVSPRRAKFFQTHLTYLDIAYFDLNLPVSAMLGTDPSGTVPMVGSASSASSASAVLTITPAPAQNLVGSASSGSSAGAGLTQTPAAPQSLVGAASSASAASATLTETPVPAQHLTGAASSVSSASGALSNAAPGTPYAGSASSASSASAILTITPAAPQPLVGSASSASAASAALTQMPPGGLLGSASSSSSASAILTITPPSATQHLVGSASSASSASAILTNGIATDPVVLRGTENVLIVLAATETVI